MLSRRGFPRLRRTPLRTHSKAAMTDVHDRQTALFRAGSHNGPAMLYDWWQEGEITTAELRELILGVWSGADWPLLSLDEGTWIEWFEETGFVSDSGCEKPSEPVTVYRGASIASAGRGMSWTFEIDRARWFAERELLVGHGPAGVYEVVVPPTYLLAIVERERPGEAEAIVDPALFDIREPGDFLAAAGFPPMRLLERITESPTGSN
jgi:hypothetical protein